MKNYFSRYKKIDMQTYCIDTLDFPDYPLTILDQDSQGNIYISHLLKYDGDDEWRVLVKVSEEELAKFKDDDKLLDLVNRDEKSIICIVRDDAREYIDVDSEEVALKIALLEEDSFNLWNHSVDMPKGLMNSTCTRILDFENYPLTPVDRCEEGLFISHELCCFCKVELRAIVFVSEEEIEEFEDGKISIADLILREKDVIVKAISSCTARLLGWYKYPSRNLVDKLPHLQDPIVQRKVLSEEQLREVVAAEMHEIWKRWFSEWNQEDYPEIEHRWRRRMSAYEDLSEEEKDSDRREADKIISTIRKEDENREIYRNRMTDKFLRPRTIIPRRPPYSGY